MVPAPTPPALRPHAGEPEASPWRWTSAVDVLARLTGMPPPPGVPVVAVDGRSGGGKSTVAAALQLAGTDVAVVHTDDVAWHESFFDWSHLLRDDVLAPVAAGDLPVVYRPPAWDRRERDGAIVVPRTCRLLVVEGVGAGRRDLADLVDALVWVQSDAGEARRRGIERDGGDEAAVAFWEEWQAAEEPFLDEERPWERADVVVAGTAVDAAPAPGGTAELGSCLAVGQVLGSP